MMVVMLIMMMEMEVQEAQVDTMVLILIILIPIKRNKNVTFAARYMLFHITSKESLPSMEKIFTYQLE